MEPKTCKGCITTIKKCTIVTENLADRCPCQMCIVKSMCKQGCREYLIITSKSRKLYYKRITP